MKSNLKVRYELDESGWWVASIDAVPGCHTQGRTIEQARERVREALAALTSDKIASRAKLEDDVRLPPAARKAVDLSVSKRAVAARLTAEAEDAVRDAAQAASALDTTPPGTRSLVTEESRSASVSIRRPTRKPATLEVYVGVECLWRAVDDGATAALWLRRPRYGGSLERTGGRLLGQWRRGQHA